MAVIKSKHPSHQKSSLRRMTSQRTPLPRAAVDIPCKLERCPISHYNEPRGISVVKTHDLRMVEAAGNIPIIVGGLGRCERHRTTYRTMSVAGRKKFPSGGLFDRQSIPAHRRQVVYDEGWEGKCKVNHAKAWN